MPLPDLSSLPEWAQALIYAIIGLSIGAAFIAARLGLTNKPSGETTKETVAAVIVDSSALNRATAALEGLTVALLELKATGVEIARNNKRVADEMDRVREEIRINRESARRG